MFGRQRDLLDRPAVLKERKDCGRLDWRDGMRAVRENGQHYYRWCEHRIEEHPVDCQPAVMPKLVILETV